MKGEDRPSRRELGRTFTLLDGQTNGFSSLMIDYLVPGIWCMGDKIGGRIRRPHSMVLIFGISGVTLLQAGNPI